MAATVPDVTSVYNNFKKKKRGGSSLVVGIEPPAATVTATVTTTAGAAVVSVQPLGALRRAPAGVLGAPGAAEFERRGPAGAACLTPTQGRRPWQQPQGQQTQSPGYPLCGRP